MARATAAEAASRVKAVRGDGGEGSIVGVDNDGSNSYGHGSGEGGAGDDIEGVEGGEGCSYGDHNDIDNAGVRRAEAATTRTAANTQAVEGALASERERGAETFRAARARQPPGVAVARVSKGMRTERSAKSLGTE
jgi:hypothetical protein